VTLAQEPRPRYRALFGLVVVPSAVIALLMATLYFVVIPLVPEIHAYYFPEQARTYATYWVPLYIHIIGGTTALILGPINLIIGLRGSAHGRLHPIIGRVYAVAVAVAAPAAIVMAFHSYAGTLPGGRLIATSGFAVLGLLWFVTTAVAVHAIAVRRNVRAHRFWMVVGVSMVYAAVTLRLENGILLGLGQHEFEALYPLLAWTCWVPNLVVGLLLARRLDRRSGNNASVSGAGLQQMVVPTTSEG
jgi:hypothetical protein